MKKEIKNIETSFVCLLSKVFNLAKDEAVTLSKKDVKRR